jgi:hypothetical protein
MCKAIGNICLVLILLLVVMPMSAAVSQNQSNASSTAAIPAAAADNMATAIVIDCSDSGESMWRNLLVLGRESLSLLQPGDWLVLISAHNGNPALEMSALIDPNNTSTQIRLSSRLLAVRREFWARSRIAEAVAFAREELMSQGVTAKACILITDGQSSDRQIDQLRHIAARLRADGIALLVTASNAANANLLLAANQGELDVTTLDHADIAGWLSKVRPHRTLPTPAVPVPSDGPERSQQQPVVAPPQSPNPQQTQTPVINIILPSQPASPVAMETKPAPPAMPGPSSPLHTIGQHLTDSNAPHITAPPLPLKSLAVPWISNTNTPPVSVGEPNTRLTTNPVVPGEPNSVSKSTEAKQSWFKQLNGWRKRNKAIISLIAFLCLFMVLVSLICFGHYSWGQIDNRDKGSEDIGTAILYNIFATHGDERVDLGEEATLPPLWFGSGPESVISMEAEGILPKEFSLKRTRRGFSIRNHSPEILTVNGLPVRQHRSVDITLPATIQSSGRFYISVTREPEQIQPEQAEGEK